MIEAIGDVYGPKYLEEWKAVFQEWKANRK
jgi:hypothetical protein